MFFRCCQLLGLVLKPILLLIIFVAILPLIPNLPPDFKFSTFPAPEPPSLTGKYTPNKLLNGAERLFEGKIIGPEGFAILNGELYTTLHGGYVAKIGQSIEPVVKFGLPCEGLVEEAKCGRPLGIFAGGDDLLFITDAYYGVFTYNVVTGMKHRLFGPEITVGGRSPKLFNSISVSSNGKIYWSDSSTDVTLQDGLYTMLADGTGRLIEYNPSTNEHKVLIDGLQFANGVALSPDESFVLVADTGMSRIHRIFLRGPQAGQTDIFIENLPGMPDNLRAGSEGFLVSLVTAADEQNPNLAHAIYPFPYMRKALARATALAELAFETVDRYYPNAFCKQAVHFIGHFEMIKPLMDLRVTLVVLDVKGNVVDAFFATDGSVVSISDAIVYRGSLYLGSPFNQYLGRVKNSDVVTRFQKAFPSVPQYSVKIKSSETQKKPTTASKPTTTQMPPTTSPKPTTTQRPTTTTQRPATTTPKPTTAQRPTTTTQRPATTTPKPTTAQRPTTTTPKPTTTTPRPATTTPKPATTQKPTTTQRPTAATAPKPTNQKPSPTKEPSNSGKSNTRESNEL